MRRTTVLRSLCAIGLASLLLSCASGPPVLPDVPERSAIKAAAAGFSPVGDEATRTIDLALTYGNKDAVVSWTVKIATGSVVLKELSGAAPDLPDTVSWDGKNELGQVCPEGEYYALLSVGYGATYNPSPIAWDKFLLVASRPQVELSALPPTLVPSGKGMVEGAMIDLTAASRFAKPVSWTIDIVDPTGVKARAFTGSGAAGGAEWDGSTDDGGWARPSTIYTAMAAVVDEYGNQGLGRLDIPIGEAPEASEASEVTALTPAFSPTGDPEGRSMRLALSFGNAESVASWSLKVAFGSAILKEFSGLGSDLPATIDWDGLNDAGSPWPEGEYSAGLWVDYGLAYKGATAAPASFILVSSAPSLSIGATPPYLTPSGKGMAESVSIDLKVASRFAKAAGWSIDILDPRGQSVRRFEGEGEGGLVKWDGTTEAGTLAEPSKVYTAVAAARDEFGNSGKARLEIAVRSQPDAPEPSTIRALSPGFSPTGDPSKRSMSFALGFGNREALKAWSMEIATGSVVLKKVSGTASNLPSTLSWDGKSETLSIWPEGEYRAILSLDYGKAFNPGKVLSDPFLLVSSPPTLRMSAAPPSFTPRGQGMAAPVAIGIDASSRLAKIPGWTVDILDTRGAVLRSFSGPGAGGTVSWDGSLSSGTYAESSKVYTARATARDEYGNKGQSTLEISVKESGDAPVASLIETDMKGFSPSSGRNEGQIPFSILVGNSAECRAWKVEISDSSGTKRSFAGGPLDAPVSLAWDGKDASGALAPEGQYRAVLSVDYGRTYRQASARTKDFILSTSAPTGKLTLSPEAFEPSEKGVAAPISILLEASSPLAKIDQWSLDIVDDQGRAVQAFAQKWPSNQAVWDGQTLAGAFVEPAKDYAARARILDEFGNEGTASATIKVREIPAATELSVIEPRSSGFSPLDAAGKKAMDFFIVAGNAAQMKSWKVTVSHSERGIQKVYSGLASTLGKTLSWDGKTESGSVAPDGKYFATLSIDYGKSFKPAAVKSTAFALQTASPEVTLSLAPPRFKPLAGAFEQAVQITLGTSSRFSEVEGWTLSVFDPSGAAVALFKDVGTGGTISWDGKTSAGKFLDPSTTYTVAAEVRDSWGNVGTARTYLPVDDLPAVPGEISITPLADGLSPNGDGILDSLDFKLAITNTESLQSWRFVVSHSASGPQKTYTGEASALGDTITWNGRNDTGGLPPEGVYTAELFIDYGSTYKAVSVKSRKFVLDAVPPKLLLTIEPPSLVPDEGGLVSPAKISLDAQSAFARMSSWKLSLVDASAKVLNSYAGDWPPPALSWDGVAQDGSLAKPNSAYTVIATITDQFGLSTQTKSELAVGGLPPATEQSSVLALSKGFSPAAKGSMKLALAFGNKNLIKAWRLDIEREDRSVRMRFPGSPAMGDSFTWDGKLQDGTVAPDGRYTASLSLDYGRVYAPTTAASAAFVLASTPPQASLSLVPPLFSPDGDGEGESLTISLAAETRYAAINDWNLSIFDPAGNLFTSFKGKWPPAPIVWNGRNAKNETVESAEDYPVVARVRDEFGNTSEVKSAAHVDILLVRVGDGYRIRIASIVFKPFTADYLDVSPDLAERNLSALNLLAEKLKKFPGYQIRLIGHAVMVNWDDPAKGRAEQAKVLIPLSRSRAEAIMQALAQRGVEAGRMVADGAGAADPVVPDSDFENRWKNRRVEFFLQKKR